MKLAQLTVKQAERTAVNLSRVVETSNTLAIEALKHKQQTEYSFGNNALENIYRPKTVELNINNEVKGFLVRLAVKFGEARQIWYKIVSDTVKVNNKDTQVNVMKKFSPSPKQREALSSADFEAIFKQKEDIAVLSA